MPLVTVPRLLMLSMLTVGFLAAGAVEAQPTRSNAKLSESREAALERIWWNREDRVETLGLTEEQRSKMDQALSRYFETRDSLDRSSAVQEFRDALSAGDVERARGLIERTTEAYNAPMVAQMTLSVDVIELLTPEQLDLIQENYPKLLTRPWVRLSRMRGMNAARGGQDG